MNIEERALVRKALEWLELSIPMAEECLKQALEVRKAPTVCEKCLRIGTCEDCKPKLSDDQQLYKDSGGLLGTADPPTKAKKEKVDPPYMRAEYNRWRNAND